VTSYGEAALVSRPETPRVGELARRRLALIAICATAICATAATAGSSVGSAAQADGVSRGVPWWSRSFEAPEELPEAYPFCCGSYWDTLLVSETSSGTIARDSTRRRNHVFAAHTGPNDGRDFADWSFLTQDHTTSRGHQGMSVWVRMRMYFPRSFRPTGYSAGESNSEWNWLTTFHESKGWAGHCSSADPSTVALGILNRRPRRRAPNPRFRLHLVGGVQTTGKCIPKLRRIDGPRVRLGRWYSVLEHVVFSPSDEGLVEIWINGRRMASVHFPTMYRHPDGSVGDYYFCFGYYRRRASWDATVLFDDVTEGPTRGSVTRSKRRSTSD
jgi:Polysaccharide lyase